MLSPSLRQVTHALLTRPPLSFKNFTPKGSASEFSLDLHVLGTPPAFILSQDQTLNWLYINYPLGYLISFNLCQNYFWLPFLIRFLLSELLSTLKWFFSEYYSNSFSGTLFNFQGPISLPPLRQELYYTSEKYLCQAFFSTFFRFFSDILPLSRQPT